MGRADLCCGTGRAEGGSTPPPPRLSRCRPITSASGKMLLSLLPVYSVLLLGLNRECRCLYTESIDKDRRRVSTNTIMSVELQAEEEQRRWIIHRVLLQRLVQHGGVVIQHQLASSSFHRSLYVTDYTPHITGVSHDVIVITSLSSFHRVNPSSGQNVR